MNLGLEEFLDGPSDADDDDECTVEASCLDSRTPSPALPPEEEQEAEVEVAEPVRSSQDPIEATPEPRTDGDDDGTALGSAVEVPPSLPPPKSSGEAKAWGQAVEQFAPDHNYNADQTMAPAFSPRPPQRQSSLVAAYGPPIQPPKGARGESARRGRPVRLRPVGAEADDKPEGPALPPPDHPTPSYPLWRPPSSPPPAHPPSGPRPPQGPRPIGGPRRPSYGGSNASNMGGATRSVQDSVTELPELRTPGRQRKSPLDAYKGRPFPSARGPASGAASKGKRQPKALHSKGPIAEHDLDLKDAGLPRLANDEDLEAWRNQVADSALRFARVCDVPHSMLRNCGAIALG